VSPLVSIWLHPRSTLREHLKSTSPWTVIGGCSAAAFAAMLSRAQGASAGDQLSVAQILGLALLIAVPWALVILYVTMPLVRLAGSWLGGQATSADLRVATAWSMVPVLWSLPLWVPKILLFGREAFSTTSTPRIDTSGALTALYLLFLLVDLVVFVWYLVLSVVCVAEANRFSTWRAIGAMLLGALIFGVPLVAAVAFLIMTTRA
jgi:hypothetical protein